ncbi:MAG: thiamine phosphate synthase [Muribaculaceae bacterium]
MVDSRMKLIAITPESFIDNEVAYITMILDNGFDYVHIRKPKSTITEVRLLIKSIPQEYHKRLKLHGFYELTKEFDIAGIHLNKQYPAPISDDCRLKLSKSCHTLEELNDASNYEYVFLSPIFDSISKVGYKSHFNLSEISNNFRHSNVVALGGVNASHLNEIKHSSFYGAAFLGYLFSAETMIQLETRLNEINKNIK